MSTSKHESIYNSLLLSIPTITILTATIIHTLFSYFQHKAKFNKSLTFTALLSFFIFLIFSLILLYISIRGITQTITESDCILFFIKDSLMIIGKIFMYLFFIGRIFYVFHGSLFAYDRKQILRYIAITFIVLFTPALLILTAVLLPIHSVIHKQHSIQTIYDCSDIFQAHLSASTKIMFISGISIFTLFDIIISIVILRAFVSRLLWLYTWCTKNQMQKNTFLLKVAMKSFNLTAAAITTSWFGILFNASGYGSHWLCIDIIVSVLAMYLSFAFTANIYDRISIICCCTNCCFIGWKKLCWCCCLKYEFEIPKNIEMSVNQMKGKSEEQVPDTSVIEPKTQISQVDNGESILSSNGIEVILHDYEKKHAKPKLSNLSNNIKN